MLAHFLGYYQLSTRRWFPFKLLDTQCGGLWHLGTVLGKTPIYAFASLFCVSYAPHCHLLQPQGFQDESQVPFDDKTSMAKATMVKHYAFLVVLGRAS